MLKINLDTLFLIDKKRLADALFHIAVVLAFYESLHPWFLWPLGPYAYVLMALCAGGSWLVSGSMSEQPKYNAGYLAPFIAYTLLRLCSFLVNPDATFMAFISVAMQIYLFYVIFKADGDLLRRSMGLITKIMAVILIVSMAGFMLYLIGFPLPSSDAKYGEDLYSYSNYYFFLLRDADLWTLIPRFQSVFLEPSHMAIASVFLLMTEIGRWKKWYNIVLICSVLISFSLEAYVLLFCLVFLSKWIQRKHFIRNLLAIIAVFVAIIVGSFFYNDGDNMLNALIVMRLEVDDGEVAGNNRTTEEFDAEYESYLNSSDIFFGRDMVQSFGNSGYKVFIYEYGFVNLALLFIFYLLLLNNPDNKRAVTTAWLLTSIHFVVRAHMTWASCIIPLYFMARWFVCNNVVASGDAHPEISGSGSSGRPQALPAEAGTTSRVEPAGNS